MPTDHFSVQSADPGLAEAKTIIGTCNHFGFCTATCPTYAITHHENESPRGRIDLIRIMLETPGAPAPQTVRHLDNCLSCLACVSTCGVKVDYMHLIDHARAYIELHYWRSWTDRLFRFLIAKIVPDRRYFGAALAGGRLLARFARFMPRQVRELLEAVPPASNGAQDVTAGSYRAAGTVRWRVALLAGCAQRVLTPQINAATVRLLTRLGCEVVVAHGAECCGALTLHMGRTSEARASAKRNIDAWIDEAERGGLDAIIVNASGCGTTMKDYGHAFRHDPRYHERAQRVAALTVDVSEFIDRIGLHAPSVARHYKVAYHDACSLRNGQRVTRQPRRLLRSAGYVVVDVPEAGFCCGSAGTYNLLQPQIARQLGERKSRHAESTGAAMLAVGNVGCITQLSRYTQLPVVHTVELLDWATGGPMPPGLKGRRIQECIMHPEASHDAAGLISASEGETATGIGVW